VLLSTLFIVIDGVGSNDSFATSQFLGKPEGLQDEEIRVSRVSRNISGYTGVSRNG